VTANRPTAKQQARWNARLAKEGLSLSAGRPPKEARVRQFDEAYHSPVYAPCCGPDCGKVLGPDAPRRGRDNVWRQRG